ncbi:MAG TPA: ABC transporter permease, partial [Bacteroidetes bacterium]|nr:ABC transporter permease [Bacteroidota bacterium]
MGKILAFAGKDLRILLRDRSGVAFVLGFPFLFAVFFGMVFSGASGPERIPIAAVDLDQTPASRAFVARLDSLPELDVRLVADTVAAKALVRGKKCAGMLVLPKGFGEKKRNPFAAGAPEIRLGFDPAERTTAGLLEGLLT